MTHHSRRACRRRTAILGALHECGPLNADDLAGALHLQRGSLYPDLSALTTSGLITSDYGPGPVGQRLLVYRVTTPAEREEHRRGPRRRVVIVPAPRSRSRFAIAPGSA